MAEYMICVFGSADAGKSCFTMQFVDEDVYKTTLEIDGKQYGLEILDAAGSDEFSSMRDLYVKNGHGFVLVYSITSLATFNEVQKHYDGIMNVKDIHTHGAPAIVLVGNKCDTENERIVSRETGQALARRWNCTFLETSAKDRTTVAEVFYDLVRQINRKNQKKIDQTEPRVEIHKNQPTVETENKKVRCCVLL